MKPHVLEFPRVLHTVLIFMLLLSQCATSTDGTCSSSTMYHTFSKHYLHVKGNKLFAGSESKYEFYHLIYTEPDNYAVRFLIYDPRVDRYVCVNSNNHNRTKVVMKKFHSKEHCSFTEIDFDGARVIYEEVNHRYRLRFDQRGKPFKVRHHRQPASILDVAFLINHKPMDTGVCKRLKQNYCCKHYRKHKPRPKGMVSFCHYVIRSYELDCK